MWDKQSRESTGQKGSFNEVYDRIKKFKITNFARKKSHQQNMTYKSNKNKNNKKHSVGGPDEGKTGPSKCQVPELLLAFHRGDCNPTALCNSGFKINMQIDQ